MAEEFAEKTEAPTSRRREEAREQGNIARSTDLTAAVVLLFALMSLNWFGPGVIKALHRLTLELLSGSSLSSIKSDALGPAAARAAVAAGLALAPILLGVMVAAILINLMQVGFYFSGKRLQPNFEALNPMRGFSRMFEARSVVHLLGNLLKLGLVGWLAWSAATERLSAIVATQDRTVSQVFALGASIVWAVGIRVAFLLLVLALLDYGWQKFKTERDLRMSRQEILEEMRRMDGDPKLKQRRRQLAVQMQKKRLNKDVPTADVVVTNPTEYAVALKYDAATMHAPRVVAKGQGLLAQRIREIAIEHGIPILERKPLARALYRMVDVGKEIPEQFYTAVAEILAYVYELSGRSRRTQAA